MQSKRGFTLIELLVVIAIIGILATIITANLSTAQAKARDARRVADIKVIQTALALYYNNNYAYPLELSGLVPSYVPVVPKDPRTSSDYKYVPIGNGSPICNTGNQPISYHLGAILEVNNNGGLSQDADAPKNGAACIGYLDFHGQTLNCAGSQLSSTQNDPSVTESCYDWTP